MTAFAQRVALVAGGIIGLVVAAFLIVFLLHFSGLLGVLLVILLCAGTLAGCVKLAAWAWWAWKSPHVFYENEQKQVRVVVSREGTWTALDKPVLPAGLQTLNYHAPQLAAPASTPALLPAAGELESAPAPGLPRAEPFWRIREAISPGHLILGYNLDGAIPGDISDLLSTGIIGRPGTGKTTMLRFACGQVLRIGGQPFLMDPHGSIVDELGDLLECAEDASSIERLAARLEQELDRRLLARRAGQSIGAPMLLLADEWPIISQLAAEAVRVIGRVILEGRKVGVYALVSGQGLPADQLGGSLFRDALSSRYVFCTTPAQARMAGMDNETAKSLMARLETAGPGYAILASARRRPEIVAIPDTTPDDLRVLVGSYELPPLPMKTVDAASLSSLSLSEQPAARPKSAADAERERIIAALREHPDWSNSRIALALGYRNNNKITLIKAIREESQAEEA
jgi:hypothetical protein